MMNLDEGFCFECCQPGECVRMITEPISPGAIVMYLCQTCAEKAASMFPIRGESEMKENCQNCRYSAPVTKGDGSWRQAPSLLHTLVCRRNAPVVLTSKDCPYQYRPMTSEQGWCGEWKAEPATTCTMHLDPGLECLDKTPEEDPCEKCVQCGGTLTFSSRAVGDGYCHRCGHKVSATERFRESQVTELKAVIRFALDKCVSRDEVSLNNPYAFACLRNPDWHDFAAMALKAGVFVMKPEGDS
ncbi:hypothetical protein LCGC14_0336110 [marine sediment metagenome]|uniref:Uncharacterized protein n=1 Tax=marine sediment metagenome TaxID=412755 RepID=A0A0F9W233_9ZZZZ